MKITTVLFDLDGTLLPMDQDEFTKEYFRYLSEKMEPYGYQPKSLIEGIWAGTAAMVKNDGSRTNEEVFWSRFCEIFGEGALRDKPVFDEFYKAEFERAAKVCGFDPKAGETVRRLKERGYRTALASNPIFPNSAQCSRVRWAGLSPDDFEVITSYENTRACKPNPQYYDQLVSRLGCRAEECLMVGNDAQEDTAAVQAGIHVFLLTNCLINKSGDDVSRYPQGDFNALYRYLEGEREGVRA